MAIDNNNSDLHLKGRKIQGGIRLAYKKLVEKKAKEGGVLILSVNGKATPIPATELLEKMKKSV